MEIDQKFYLLHFDVEGVEQVEGDDGFDVPADEDVEDGGFDDLEDEVETTQQMETDRIQQTPRNSTTVGDITVNHRTCADIPESWEEINLNDERLCVFASDSKSCCVPVIEDDWECSPKSGLSLPGKLDYNMLDDEIWDFEPVDYGCIDVEAMSQLENSVSAAYCSQVLADLNSADTDDESFDNDDNEDLGDMDFLPQDLVSKFGSARKNLFPVLEKLAESSEKPVVVEKLLVPGHVNKSKWGPVMATSRMNTRFHGDLNVLDKAKEYQKRKNLEIPSSFKGSKLARCQGGFAKTQKYDQKLEPLVPEQTLCSTGCEPAPTGSSSWGIAPDYMDMKALLRGLADKAPASSSSGDRVDCWHQEMICEKLIEDSRLSLSF